MVGRGVQDRIIFGAFSWSSRPCADYDTVSMSICSRYTLAVAISHGRTWRCRSRNLRRDFFLHSKHMSVSLVLYTILGLVVGLFVRLTSCNITHSLVYQTATSHSIHSLDVSGISYLLSNLTSYHTEHLLSPLPGSAPDLFSVAS